MRSPELALRCRGAARPLCPLALARPRLHRRLRRAVRPRRPAWTSTATCSTALRGSRARPARRLGAGDRVRPRRAPGGAGRGRSGWEPRPRLLAVMVRTEDATSRPDGLELIGAVLWRASSTASWTACCCPSSRSSPSSRPRGEPPERLLVRQGGDRRRRAGRVARHDGGLSPGYSDFRSSAVRKPVTGDVVWSVPTLVTLNPVGAPIAHAGMHVTAVLHSYETDTFLPPHE